MTIYFTVGKKGRFPFNNRGNTDIDWGSITGIDKTADILNKNNMGWLADITGVNATQRFQQSQEKQDSDGSLAANEELNADDAATRRRRTLLLRTLGKTNGEELSAGSTTRRDTLFGNA